MSVKQHGEERLGAIAQRAGGVHGSTYIALREEVWTEDSIVVEVESSAELKRLTERCDGCCFCQLLHTTHASELLVGVLRGRQTRGSS